MSFTYCTCFTSAPLCQNRRPAFGPWKPEGVTRSGWLAIRARHAACFKPVARVEKRFSLDAASALFIAVDPPAIRKLGGNAGRFTSSSQILIS